MAYDAKDFTTGLAHKFKTSPDPSAPTEDRTHVVLDPSAPVGAVDETAPANDTASSGLNGRLQRIAQRLTDAIGQLTTAVGHLATLAGGGISAVAWGTTASEAVGVQGGTGMVPFTINHSSTGVGHGVTVVTTAGTDVVLAASTPAKWVIIQAQTDNTDKVVVGATGVDATVATGNGVVLDAGESITLPVDDLADVFIDSLVSGEGVRYVYGT